jgi:hypothetical protein
MLFKFLKYKAKKAEPDYSRALIIQIDVSGPDFGTDKERNTLLELEEKIDDKIEGERIGISDGHEFGDGEFTMYLYGSDIDGLLEVIKPYLKSSTFRPIRINRRYGAVDDDKAKEKKTKII